jgi:site-specific recombinase XerD
MKNTPLLTLHEAFCQDAFLRNYRPTTIGWWKGSLQMLLNHFSDDVLTSVSDLTHERLRRYLYEKRVGGWSADTFNNQYRALKAFFNWCVKHGHIGSDPLAGIERPRLEKKLPKRLTKEEAERVLEHAFHADYHYRFLRFRNRAVIAVMLYAGLRASETLNLKMGDVDLPNRTLFVRCGKGAKDRMVPMSAALARYLSEYLDDRRRLRRTSAVFFTSLQGDRPFTYRGLRRLVDRIKAATGIAFSSHRLRHTFATLMLEGGCDLFSLQKMMGHSDIQTTTIYLSATMTHLKGQISKHPLG